MGALQHVLDTVVRLRPELSRRHVRKIGVFGSVARGVDRADSDVDFLVELTEQGDLFDLAGIKRLLEQELGRSVDVVPIGGLKDDVRDAILGEVRYAA
jgi:predicted nucleotidyltransferase